MDLARVQESLDDGEVDKVFVARLFLSMYLYFVGAFLKEAHSFQVPGHKKMHYAAIVRGLNDLLEVGRRFPESDRLLVRFQGLGAVGLQIRFHHFESALVQFAALQAVEKTEDTVATQVLDYANSLKPLDRGCAQASPCGSFSL